MVRAIEVIFHCWITANLPLHCWNNSENFCHKFLFLVADLNQISNNTRNSWLASFEERGYSKDEEEEEFIVDIDLDPVGCNKQSLIPRRILNNSSQVSTVSLLPTI